ncbi:unnamed protein product [Paramecium octaurelia]|uniref:Uncharacterized protein n=1 Tax=Paramecium octaurelia TaxID=43137 RepID=A0A8S1X3Y5_PAROT|nr:unnamed protein product [Paramecium octaurelia]
MSVWPKIIINSFLISKLVFYKIIIVQGDILQKFKQLNQSSDQKFWIKCIS